VWLGRLGNACHILGQSQRAIQYYKKALAIARDIDQRWREGMWLGKLGSAYQSLGQFERAIEFHRAALIVAREIDDRRGRSYQLLGLGRTLLTVGRISEAHQSLVESLKLNVSVTCHWAALALGIVLLRQSSPAAQGMFAEAVDHCWTMLAKTASLYETRYTLAAALVGQSVCDPRWKDESKRPDLLAPALEEYRRALDITAAPGVVQDAIRDLELIQAAGIEGLDPVFELLESAEYEPDLPEELPDILEDFLEEDRE
jgi:tetratricopeptide (TPR) repeat protein